MTTVVDRGADAVLDDMHYVDKVTLIALHKG